MNSGHGRRLTPAEEQAEREAAENGDPSPSLAIAIGMKPNYKPAEAAGMATSLNPRLAPQDENAERCVLGGIMLDESAAMDVVGDLAPEDFYREANREVYRAMMELIARHEPVDVVTVGHELLARGTLHMVGGAAYLAMLDTCVPVGMNIRQYARMVSDHALSRRLVETGHRIAQAGYAAIGTLKERIDAAQSAVMKISERRESGGPKPIRGMIKGAFEELEMLYERKSEITGVASGISQLDLMTAGFQPKNLIIVAARASMGKTSWALNIAAKVAETHPVVVFSLEMSERELVRRLFSSEAKVDGQRLRNGQFDGADWTKLSRAADTLFHSKMLIDDQAGLSILDLRMRARRAKIKYPDMAMCIVDYLQLLRSPGQQNREREIGEISNGLKEMAKELNMPVIALSQLNRSLEKRDDKRPQLSDLRESGNIEQDADLICFIYRDEVYNKESEHQGIAEIIVGKQRNGPTGTVRTRFNKQWTRFDQIEEDRDRRYDDRYENGGTE